MEVEADHCQSPQMYVILVYVVYTILLSEGFKIQNMKSYCLAIFLLSPSLHHPHQFINADRKQKEGKSGTFFPTYYYSEKRGKNQPAYYQRKVSSLLYLFLRVIY